MSGSPSDALRAATLPEPDHDTVEALTAAHRAARQVLKDSTSAAVGWTVATQAFESVRGADDAWRHYSRLWEDRFLEVSRDDDWVGVQSYSSQLVGPDGPQGARPGVETTQQGWEFRPDAVGIAVRHAASVAAGVPIMVTENGVAVSGDSRRVAFIDGSLQALHAAVEDGIDARGYCYGTLIDNFEWTQGYATTFGLVAVNRHTFARTPNPSARYLGHYARRSTAPTGDSE